MNNIIIVKKYKSYVAVTRCTSRWQKRHGVSRVINSRETTRKRRRRRGDHVDLKEEETQ